MNIFNKTSCLLHSLKRNLVFDPKITFQTDVFAEFDTNRINIFLIMNILYFTAWTLDSIVFAITINQQFD